MLQLEVLILELGAVDRLPARTVASREVSALDHELLDDPVEGRALVREQLAGFAFTLLPRAERAEVLSCLGNNVIIEFEGHSAFRFRADTKVEEDSAALGGSGGHDCGGSW